MKKSIVALILVITLILSDSSMVFAAEESKQNDVSKGQGIVVGQAEPEETEEIVKYQVDNILYFFEEEGRQVTVAGTNISEASVIVIPEEICIEEQSYPVNAIQSEAFANMTSLRSVVFPDSIVNFPDLMFHADSELTIYCNYGSAAETYAKENNINYSLDLYSLEVAKEELIIGERTPISIESEILENNIVGKIEKSLISRDENILSVQDEQLIANNVGDTVVDIDYCGIKKTLEIKITEASMQKEEEVKQVDGRQNSVNKSVQSRESDFEYTVSDSGLIISKYIGTESVVSIPNTIAGLVVTEIGEMAFHNYTDLQKIVIPEGVERISRFAFEGCTGLREVKLPGKLKSMGEGAFGSCDGLTGIEIPKSLEDGGSGITWSGAFNGCKNLKDVKFEEGTKQIAASLFAYCSGLEEVVIPETIEVIDKDAFLGADSLKKVSIGSGVKEIKEGAFQYCKSLQTVTIPDSVISIGDFAFQECSNLSQIKLSGNLKSMGAWAFGSCNGLTGIEIPKSLEDGGSGITWSGAFNECENLKDVKFEEGTKQIAASLFAYCSGLEEIIIPETVEVIDKDAFLGADSLKKVSIGSGVKEIKEGAFQYCKSLQAVIIPDSVISIGDFAFQECSNLSQIKLSGNLKSMGAWAFGSCNGLTEIEIPKSLEDGGSGITWSGAFNECENLKDVKFEEGTKQIAASLFSNCNGLEQIMVPETVKKIGSDAFRNCEGLQKVYFTDGEISIDSDAFLQCPNAVFYCPAASYALVYAMDHSIDFVVTGGGFKIPDKSVLVKESTSYELNSSTAITNGTMQLNLDYAIKDEIFNSMSDKEIVIKIPDIAALIPNSLTLDGAIYEEYQEEGSRIIIPVEKKSGKIRLSIDPGSDGKILSYAYLTDMRNENLEQNIIGIINEFRTILSINAPSLINDASVEISGVAPANTEAIILIDDMEVVRATSKKNGAYSTTIQIPEPVEGRTYKISIRCNETEASTRVKYSIDEPILTEFNMYYNGMVYDLLDKSIINSVTFIGAAYSFRVRFENAHNVDIVKITSERNGVVKAIEAKWDNTSKSFIADGWFDPDAHDYVPGVMNVYYTTKGTGEDMNDPETAFSKTDGLSEEWKNAKIDVITDTTSKFAANINIENKGTLEYACQTYSVEEMYQWCMNEIGANKAAMSLSAYQRSTDSSLMTMIFRKLVDLGFDVANDGMKSAIKQDGKSIKTIHYDAAKGYFVSETVEMLTESQASNIAEFALGNTFDNAGGSVVFSLGYGSVQNMLSWGNTYYDIEGLKNEIRVSDRTQQQKQSSLSHLKYLETLSTDILIVRSIGTVLSAAGKGIILSGGGVVAGGALFVCGWFIQDILAEFMQKDLDNCIGMYKGNTSGVRFRWVIDPSGYVYEGVSENRLSGVTATIYYKDPETRQAVQWNADEYEQGNPLVTDEYGTYAWDVPEGMWCVKYQKEGYEEYTTAWMEVPPPQTGINIGLISKEAPEIEVCNVYADHAIVVFSKYMDPAKVSYMVLKDSSGKNIKYSLEYDTSLLNEQGKNYAKEYKLFFEEGYIADTSKSFKVVMSRKMLDYAGIAMNEGEEIVPDSMNDLGIQLPETVTIANNELAEITVKIKNYTGSEELTCASNFKEIADIESISNIARDGSATVKINANMQGTTIFTFGIKGTSITAMLAVMVGDQTDIGKIPFSINIKRSAYAVAVGKTIEIIPEIYPANKNGGKWSIVDNKENVSVSKNTFKGIKEGIVKARYTLNDDSEIYSECTIKVEKTKINTPSKPKVSIADAGYNSQKISWTEVKNAAGYEIYQAESSNGSYTKVKTITNQSTTSYTIGKRVTGKRYYYKIRAYVKEDGSNVYGSYSSAVSGYTKPSTIQITSVSSVSYNKLKITWKKSNGAKGYQIYRSLSSGGSYSKAGTVNNGSTVTYTDNGVSTGKTYYYKVRPITTVSGTTVAGSFSDVKSGKANVNTPTISKITGGTKAVTLEWNNVSGESGYQVYMAASQNGTYSKLKTLNANATSYTKTGLSTAKTYYFKVRAYRKVNGVNVYSSFSTIKSAATRTLAPTITSVTGGAGKATVKWKAVTGASGYVVYMSTSSGGTYKNIGTTKSVTTSLTKTGLSSARNYYFKVRAYRSAGGGKVYSSFSAGKWCGTATTTPAISKITAGSKKISLQWKDVSGESAYQVYMATSKTGTYSKVTTSKANTTSFTKHGLIKGKTYYFKIRTYRKVNGQSVYSNFSAVKSAKVK